MHTVWKSWGRVHEVFAKFWEGGYIGVVKIWGGGYTFLVLYCIFINKFCKHFGGRVHFYPLTPLTPPPPVCIYVTCLKNSEFFNILSLGIAVAQVALPGRWAADRLLGMPRYRRAIFWPLSWRIRSPYQNCRPWSQRKARFPVECPCLLGT